MPALQGIAVDAYVRNRLIQRFVTLSDMALQLTTPIAAAFIADVLSNRKCTIFGPMRGGLSIMLRDIAPESWLAKHFPTLVGRHKDDRATSVDDVLCGRHVAHATKSYLLAMAALWNNSEDAMRACLAGPKENDDGLDLAGGERAVTAMMNGVSIKAACRVERINRRDFEQALRRTGSVQIAVDAPDG